ncbi:MAG TPA: ABC transporter substrate-binding protein, partial [Afifellaceae bacterium]|nr:ABC transporter substrate-binding protein [Afifellaceae bacterium]
MTWICSRISRVIRLGAFSAGVVFAASAASAAGLIEPPFLAESVNAGDLPPVAERVPAEPSIVDLARIGKKTGQYGGTLRTLIGRAKDTRRLVVYGYARLVGYDENLEYAADILKDFTVEEGRIFTFHLRRGHRWSDGHPFTSEDFRYFWEDVQTNEELAPGGVTRELLVDGEKPKVEIIDELTIRYSWSKPNPVFLQALAAPNPLYIYRPAHFLKQYHASYTDRDKLAEMAETAGKRNWVALHFSHDRPYNNSDPTRPVLQPWILMTEPPSDRFVFHRNPYYHRLDAEGHQLPYIDRVTMSVSGSKLIPAKVASGESDLQSDYISFNNYTFLKKGEKRNGFTVHRWVPGKGAKIALFPNMNHKDPIWRKLFQSRDFRHALSLSINRDDINKAIYYGLGLAGNNTVLPQSSLSKPDYRDKWARYDPEKANRILDDLGLSERGADGIRKLPNGEPMVIVVETAGEDTEQVDVLELVADDWR